MTRANGQSRSLTAVVGANCRRIRTELGLTQDALAAYAYEVGLPWNTSKLANFEAARWTPTFRDVLLLGVALERARPFAAIQAMAAVGSRDRSTRAHRAITLADLLETDTPVALRPGVELSGAQLAEIGRGKPFPLLDTTASPAPALAEQRLARTLGIDSARLADMSSQLWGRTFGKERDGRAGVGANQQKKGRISRELRAELEKAITNGND